MKAMSVERHGEPKVLQLTEADLPEPKPDIDHVLPLREAAEAHRLLEGRKSIGKIILNMDA